MLHTSIRDDATCARVHGGIQSLVLTVSVAVVFFNFTSLFFYSLTMLLHISGFKNSVLAIAVIVITFSVTAVFHTASVIRTCCLLRSSCSSSQIYFQLAFGLRVYFENLFLTVGLSYLRFVFHTMI